MRLLFLLCLSLFAIPGGTQTQTPIPREYVGHWRGKGEIIVTWCQQKQLPLDLTIDAQGNVNGTIGDASIKNGRLKKYKNWFQKSDSQEYFIEENLDGAIVATENIRRKKVWVVLGAKGNQLEGGLNISGWHLGGKNHMFLSVRRIVLKQMPE